MQVKIQPIIYEGFIMPRRVTPYSAAYDIYLPADIIIEHINHGWTLVPLGFKMELPKGYCAKIILRSSISTLIMRGGLIDADYRGGVKLLVASIKRNSEGDLLREDFCQGQRICQMLIERVEDTELVLADSLTDTIRGEGGIGSSGK